MTMGCLEGRRQAGVVIEKGSPAFIPLSKALCERKAEKKRQGEREEGASGKGEGARGKGRGEGKRGRGERKRGRGERKNRVGESGKGKGKRGEGKWGCRRTTMDGIFQGPAAADKFASTLGCSETDMRHL